MKLFAENAISKLVFRNFHITALSYRYHTYHGRALSLPSPLLSLSGCVFGCRRWHRQWHLILCGMCHSISASCANFIFPLSSFVAYKLHNHTFMLQSAHTTHTWEHHDAAHSTFHSLHSYTLSPFWFCLRKEENGKCLAIRFDSVCFDVFFFFLVDVVVSIRCVHLFLSHIVCTSNLKAPDIDVTWMPIETKAKYERMNEQKKRRKNRRPSLFGGAIVTPIHPSSSSTTANR